MPDSIERTIYKLELDGSAYIQGADSLSASTAKLSTAQEKANAKLAELQKSHNAYKKSLDETTSVIKANEKETLELTKQLNALKDAEKTTSTEALRLKAALRDVATNTKEFKIEAATLKENLNGTTTAIKNQAKEVKAAEGANVNFAGGLKKVYSGLGTIANIIPGLGIGGLVAGLSAALIELASAETLFEQKTKLLNEGLKAAAGASAGAASEVDILKIKFDLARQGLLNKKDVLEEYNNTLGKVLGVTKSFNEAEETTIKNAEAYINIVGLKARAQAIANLRIKESEKALTADLEDNRSAVSKAATFLFFNDKGNQQAYLNRVEADKKRFAAAIRNDANSRIETLTKEEIRVQEELALAQLPFMDKPKKFEKDTKKSNKDIANIYAAELQKLKADIAKLDEKGFTDEATITRAIEEDFKKRSLGFEKAFQNKQITAGQLVSLNKYLADLQKLTLEQNLKVFREGRAAYLARIESELDTLQIEENSKRIAGIQDRFEREREIIITESDKTANAIRIRRDKQIADIKKDASKNGLTVADITPQLTQIRVTYGNLLDDLQVIKNQKLQQLSFETFEKLSEDARRLLDSGNLGVSEGSLINIKKQTGLFLAGKISYEKYQKELTAISRFEAGERFGLEMLFLDQEIKRRQEKLDADKNLTAEQKTRLADEIRRLEQQKTDAEKANEITGAGQENTDNDGRLDTFLKYTQAIGGLANQVISFWASVNEAESKALDRSIELQEKRVTAAQKIAERGNAQYLKQEEDRLKDLQVKRENAARKQLGINAALQASEVIVALISGLAQGAKIGGGLGAIASVAAIVAAIAGAYAIAQSLKPPEVSFFTGTKDTGRGGRNDSKGGFSATLHPNEAVIPAKQNKAYHPTVAAIYDGTIPAEHLNRFVKNYHSIKGVPLPNYDRIKDAAELHMGQNGRMSVLLSENNKKLDEHIDLQRQTLRAMKSIQNNVTLDKNGFAYSFMEVVEQINIAKKT